MCSGAWKHGPESPVRVISLGMPPMPPYPVHHLSPRVSYYITYTPSALCYNPPPPPLYAPTGLSYQLIHSTPPPPPPPPTNPLTSAPIQSPPSTQIPKYTCHLHNHTHIFYTVHWLAETTWYLKHVTPQPGNANFPLAPVSFICYSSTLIHWDVTCIESRCKVKANMSWRRADSCSLHLKNCTRAVAPVQFFLHKLTRVN